MSAIRLNAEQRSELRRALKSHPEWKERSKGWNITIATASKDELISAAINLGVTIPGQSEQKDENDMNFQAKERPHGLSEVHNLHHRFLPVMGDMSPSASQTCQNIFDTAFGKQSGEMTTRQFAAINDIVTRAEAGKNAPKMQAAEAKAPIVTVTPAAPVSSSDPAAQLGALIAQLAGQSLNPETVARIVDERITKALEDQPSVKIECHSARAVVISEGSHHPRFIDLLKACSARMTDGFAPNVWIAGPTGSGKTHAAREVAKSMSLSFHTHGAMMMAHELMGYRDAGGNYHRTPFRDAFEHGGVVLLDECDAWDATATLALNGALANGSATFPDGMIKRHPDCIIIAAGNTWGGGATAEFVGRGKIDAAFLSRFPVRVSWDYDTELEKAICGNAAWAMQVQNVRAKARTAGLKVVIDPRQSIAGAALIAAGFSEQETASLTYLANLSADQRRQLGA